VWAVERWAHLKYFWGLKGIPVTERFPTKDSQVDDASRGQGKTRGEKKKKREGKE